MLLAASVMLATGCGGGGDKDPTGPGGGGGPSEYELVSLGRVALPADLTLEDCSTTRFYGGGLRLYEDGTWQIAMQVEDFSGEWGYLDEGVIDQDGATVWFDSEVSGTSYQGTCRRRRGEDHVRLVLQRGAGPAAGVLGVGQRAETCRGCEAANVMAEGASRPREAGSRAAYQSVGR